MSAVKADAVPGPSLHVGAPSGESTSAERGICGRVLDQPLRPFVCPVALGERLAQDSARVFTRILARYLMYSLISTPWRCLGTKGTWARNAVTTRLPCQLRQSVVIGEWDALVLCWSGTATVCARPLGSSELSARRSGVRGSCSMIRCAYARSAMPPGRRSQTQKCSAA